MANKIMIVSKFIQSNQLLLRHPSNFKRARICKPAMAFVTDIYIYFSQNQKGFGCIVAAVLLILSSKELI